MSPLAPVFVIIGFIALVGGAELLIRGASRLALTIGISPLVVGLTVVAFGTSAPEAAVSLWSTITGQSGIAVGNVVGSNIFNILFVIGLAALVVPLLVNQQLIRIDVPLMIGASVILFLMSLDGKITRIDGAILFSGIISYTVWAIRKSRRELKDIDDEYESEFGQSEGELRRSSTLLDLVIIAVGIIFLVIGSRSLVVGAVDIAKFLGVSELIIGLTIISIGTSLPEVMTSVLASIRNERDIAVGNAVGSNMFNIMAVFGLTGLVAPNGIIVPKTALQLDMPVMIVVAIACLPIFFSGHIISRWEGMLFFGYYLIYITYLVLVVLEYPGLFYFSTVMFIFILPLTMITLAVTAWREWKSGLYETEKSVFN